MRKTEFIVSLNKVDRLYKWKACHNSLIVKAMEQHSEDVKVKVVEGHGTTIDVVLVNGVLHEGDQIVVWRMLGPIVTAIRALLTPYPMKELRGTYQHHKEIKAAMGIKIIAQRFSFISVLFYVGLEHAIAGTVLYVVRPYDDLEEVKEAAVEEVQSIVSQIDRSGEGVCVQASTLGSLEALLEFLKTSEFKAYIDNIKEEKKREAADEAVFPCVMKILPNCIFYKKDPIILGDDILEGIAKIVGSNLEEQQKMYGRHFDANDELVSHITQRSIDVIKTNYQADLTKGEWRLAVKLKDVFKIQ